MENIKNLKQVEIKRKKVDIDNHLKQEENSQCADCYRTQIYNIDLNFAVFICSNCAETHKLIFKDLKFNIIEVNEDRTTELSDKELDLLKIGGNKNFRNLISLYHCKERRNDIIDKYMSKAAIYYIKLLSSKLNNFFLKEDKPSLIEGSKQIDKETALKEIVELYNFNEEIEKSDNNENIKIKECLRL